nr:uncharacterized protein LOC109156886 [Ipomoea batatas]
MWTSGETVNRALVLVVTNLSDLNFLGGGSNDDKLIVTNLREPIWSTVFPQAANQAKSNSVNCTLEAVAVDKSGSSRILVIQIKHAVTNENLGSPFNTEETNPYYDEEEADEGEDKLRYVLIKSPRKVVIPGFGIECGFFFLPMTAEVVSFFSELKLEEV